MKKFILLLIVQFGMAFQSSAYTERNLLQNSFDMSKLKESLVMNQKWVPYPDYYDRAGWDKFLGKYKNELIRLGEKYIDFDWKVVKATDYIAYERTGDRSAMQNALGANNTALGNLVIAELAEGKGRFIDQIANGVFHLCEMTSWALSAHLAALSYSRRSLPVLNDNTLELTQGDMSQMLSWTYYFLHKELDKVQPEITRRLRDELQRRELDAYMARDDFWWMGFNITKANTLNNWCPWCNSNAILCFMLLENDPDKLAAAITKTVKSVDLYLNTMQADGGLDEGPSYWYHAPGKLYDYLNALYMITGGKFSIFGEDQVKKMGEYIVRAYVGDGWVVNFADASARGGLSGLNLIYRYGKAVNSELMMGYAVEMSKKQPYTVPTSWLDISRNLEALRYEQELENATNKYKIPTYTWYPQTQFCFLTNKNNWFVATKGGYNGESHNHNDVGTISLYINNTPILIDAGVGTYTKQTFSNERYNIWTMQSDYHNLPMINGISQKDGNEYKATDVKATQNSFSANIATAYPTEAKVSKWIRSYTLGNNELKIRDEFVLNESSANNRINFLTWGKVNIGKSGIVSIEAKGEKVQLKYDATQFEASIETIKLDDSRLSTVWGNEIYRIGLTAKKRQLSGHYTYSITK